MMSNSNSSIGLGCATFGREIDNKASFEMMDYARAGGITFFDTAAAYSAGISEAIVGAWLASRRPVAGSIIIATKIQPPFESKDIIESVNESLKRLGVDTIDLLYLHQWHSTFEDIEVMATLDNLIRKGKVRMLGASNFSVEQLRKGIRLQTDHGLSPFRFVQNVHNLAVSDINYEFRQICAENAIDIVTYSPLGAGFLTGKHQSGVHPGSRFALVPGHQDIYFHEEAYQRLERLELLAARTGYTPAHLALAWALHQPGVAFVLIGGRTPAHIDQAFAALNFYDPYIFEELDLPA